ncbi:hypothetical protein ABB37_09974 [Leptomonas pyrrhocoris]|uniref:Leucine-rich repeat protein (LRRP) n=1 Tax=Leptomonas pyrrhocoris TaxID=157538 RepID=A0A0M9FPH2_LEPPY|nr:hypothetical protein ABB37_09974 [Leptomonas pyrrhocoris]XP_015651698.1 hypothetical protein ABB37_09974 [Leptomonas pyrrhocoris]KPA73258.1 hypothetical protein ABB37_09974 [Leptomonas pyrrhocoris]KPA73259.1 hypothetical protein ABB37_09974 [Leptomonas pyrrhocoris]|eukprot:XP_015651697.1 hypothetical protein ABB37_09974 [Leptomonas pyrrhocoris]
MSLQGYIQDFNASLACDSTGDARTALERLQMYNFVQITSFMPPELITRCICTLSAMSPQMRLNAETLVNYPEAGKTCGRVVGRENHLAYGIEALGTSETLPRLKLSLWWAERCGLPLSLTVDNADNDMLKLLPNSMRDRVEELNVYTSSGAVYAPNRTPESDGQRGTFLSSLLTFPNITKLSILCREGCETSRDVADVNRALRVAAQMTISEIQVTGFKQLSDFSALEGSQHLRHLKATRCGIRSVAELVSCPMLTDLDVSNNRHLQSVSDLAGAPRLTILVAKNCNLQNLDGLDSFPNLLKLDVSGNDSVESLHGLAGAESLEELAVNHCKRLCNVDGLNSCQQLGEVDVSYNEILEDVSGLAGAPSLRILNAKGCRLRNVAGLNGCPLLSEIYISDNVSLEDLSGLGGAPSLRVIKASECVISCIDGLNRCPLLSEIDISLNDVLKNLSGLAGAPALRIIKASECGLRSVGDLYRCPRLAELDVSLNRHLVNVDDLALSPSLRRLTLYGTNCTRARFLNSSIVLQ